MFRSQDSQALQFEVPNDILIVLNNIIKLSMIFSTLSDIPEAHDTSDKAGGSSSASPYGTSEQGVVALSNLLNIYNSMQHNSVVSQSISGGFYLLPLRCDAKNLRAELSSMAPGAWVRLKRLSYVDEAARAAVPEQLQRAVGGCIGPETAVQMVPVFHKWVAAAVGSDVFVVFVVLFCFVDDDLMMILVKWIKDTCFVVSCLICSHHTVCVRDVAAVMQRFFASVRPPAPRRLAASESGTPYTNLVTRVSYSSRACLLLWRVVNCVFVL
jgi:hypothetical protein